MQSRLITKQLYKMAMKEYKDKRPTEIVGYRVKTSVLLHRGFGPSIILTGMKGRIVPFLILANYGDHYRLYYILENGAQLAGAINIPTPDFERERLKFQKATTQLFQIPKPQVPEKKLEKIKKQINEKFQYYVTQIEKQTSCRVKKLPIITVYQSLVETELIIKREQDFIKFPLGLLSHHLFDGFLAREAYKHIFPMLIGKTQLAKLLGLIGTYHFLPKTLKKEWIQYWEPKTPIKMKITRLDLQKFNSFLNFLCYISKYESNPFLDAQLEKISSLFPELTKKTTHFPEIAASCYLQMANHEGNFILKAAIFFILANQLKEAKKTLKELSKFSQSDEIKQLRIQCEHLTSFHLAEIYSGHVNLASYSSDLQKLFNEAFEHIKSQVIEVERNHKIKGAISTPIKIQFKIKNLGDLTFQNIKLKDELPKKSNVEIISSNSFSFSYIRPNESITCEYQILSRTPQNIWFKNGNLTFEDNHNNHYVQIIPSTSLQVQ